MMKPEKLRLSDISILHLEIGASALQARPFAGLDSVRLEKFLNDDIDALLKNSSALLLTAPNPSDAEPVLTAIRESEHSCLMPVYLTVASSPLAEALADGIAENCDTLLANVAAIQTRLLKLPQQQLESAPPEFKLCAFMFSRPEYVLAPVRSITHFALWDYPLVSAFCADVPLGAEQIIAELELRNLLTPGRLIDRLKDCSQCDSAQLSFIDTCPDCHSIDIESSQFFHCFACGHVAQESKFVRRDSLQCPQCETQFRHIGVDYDRPLEENVCKSCSSAFIDGEVIARCLSCDTVNNPAQLRSRRVLEYSLSSRAPYAIRHGELQSTTQLVDNSHFASPSYFNQMVDWLLSLAKRYSSEHFSLLKLSIDAPEVERSVVSAQENDVFFRRMAELSRETDLVHRVGSHEIWILLPKTNREGLRLFEAEAKKLAAKLRPNLTHDEMRFYGFSVPEDLPCEYALSSVIEALQQG